MKRSISAKMLLVIALAPAILLTSGGHTAAQTSGELVATITSPRTGEQLFGQVNIQGSAIHPSAFESYTLEYSNQAETTITWLLVQPRVSQQVNNGVLGTWNTNMVPDGTYRLRLRVFLTDGQIGEYVVENLRVVNSQPTPVPTIMPDSPGIESQPAISGPTPTSPIVQPPSNNPLEGNVSGLDDASAAQPGQPDQGAIVASRTTQKTRINTKQVRSAFCSGVYLALGGFVLGGAYVLLRRQKHAP